MAGRKLSEGHVPNAPPQAASLLLAAGLAASGGPRLPHLREAGGKSTALKTSTFLFRYLPTGPGVWAGDTMFTAHTALEFRLAL